MGRELDPGPVEAMEEELAARSQSRAKAERQRSDLAREIDQLGDRLSEASGNKARESALRLLETGPGCINRELLKEKHQTGRLKKQPIIIVSVCEICNS